MQAHLARVHVREEIFTDRQRQAQRASHENCECDYDRAAVFETPRKRAPVIIAQALELAIEGIVDAPDQAVPLSLLFALLIDLHLRVQQVSDHGGDQRARQEVGSQHGEHHGQRQWCEKVLGRAGQHHHRHKDDADR